MDDSLALCLAKVAAPAPCPECCCVCSSPGAFDNQVFMSLLSKMLALSHGQVVKLAE